MLLKPSLTSQKTTYGLHRLLRYFPSASTLQIRSFMAALEEGGLTTQEPTTINEQSVHHLLAKRRETLPWTVWEEEVLKEVEKKKE